VELLFKQVLLIKPLKALTVPFKVPDFLILRIGGIAQIYGIWAGTPRNHSLQSQQVQEMFLFLTVLGEALGTPSFWDFFFGSSD
jgi:hypothetical protein